jgi:hypothetical protein
MLPHDLSDVRRVLGIEIADVSADAVQGVHEEVGVRREWDKLVVHESSCPVSFVGFQAWSRSTASMSR